MGVASSALVTLVYLYADAIVLTGPITQREPGPPEPIRYELGIQAELRSGHPIGYNTDPRGNGPLRTDVEVDPTAGIRFPLEGGGLTLAYEPRIFIVASAVPPAADGSPGNRVAYLHRGRLTLEFQPSTRWKLFLNGRAAYGQYDFSPLVTVVPGAPPGTGQPGGVTPSTPSPGLPIPGPGNPPNQRLLQVVDLSIGGGFVHLLSPSLSWLLGAGYIRSGGATPEAQLALPLQQTGLGATALQWQIGPGDAWTALLDGSYSTFSNGAHATLFDLLAVWTHTWSRTFRSDLTGGATAFRDSGVPNPAGGVYPTVEKVLPAVGLGLTQRVLQPRGIVVNVLQLRIAPVPDQLTGSIYERFDAVLLSSVPVVDRLWFDASAGVAIAVAGPEFDARVETRLTYVVLPQLNVYVGLRAGWLRGSDPAAPISFGWLGFIGFSSPFLGTRL